MSDIIPFDPTLVSQSVNFHGHSLLKQLVSENVSQIQNIKLQDIDYKVNQNRVAEIRNLGSSRVQEMIEFIASKSHYLLVSQPKLPTKELKDEDEEELESIYKDRYKYQLPLEYLMEVDKDLKISKFLETVQPGDILFTEVYNYLDLHSALLRLLAFDRGKHRHLSNIKATDLKVILKTENTTVTKADEDKCGRWLIGTRLRVEVLNVFLTGISPCVIVGTKGVTLSTPRAKEKVHLGKVQLSDLPPILSINPDPNLKYLSQCMDSMKSFKNPQCIKQLALHMNIDLHSFPSLIGTLREGFPDSTKSTALRKSQMCKWAHKSVADGVMQFKKGKHEEAFQCLSKALQIDPENVEAFVAKGALLANLGRYEKAIDDFRKSLDLNPNHVNARKYMCETLVELGKQLEEKDKLKEAEKCYLQCLELNKDHEVANTALNEVSSTLGSESEYLQSIMKEETMEKKEGGGDPFLDDLLQMETELNKKRIKEEIDPLPDDKEEVVPRLEVKQESSDVITVVAPVQEEPKKEASLSPLSQKLAMQQNLWAPPPSVNTTMSFMASTNVPPPPTMMTAPSHPPPMPDPMRNVFSNPPPMWPPKEMPLPDFTKPPPSMSFEYSEDPSYKAKVEKFLRELEIRSGSKRFKSREKSQSRKKTKRSKDDRKKRKHRSSSSSESSSSDSSQSSRSSSSSSTSSRDQKVSKKAKKAKKKKSKKSRKSSKKSKPKTTENSEIPIPDFKDLEEKLLAYYKKMESINTPTPEPEHNLSDCSPTSAKPKGKSKKKSSRRSSKGEAKGDAVLASESGGTAAPPSAPPAAPPGALMLNTHPAFLDNSDESDEPPKDAKLPSKKGAHIAALQIDKLVGKKKRVSSSSSSSSSSRSRSKSSSSYSSSRSRSGSSRSRSSSRARRHQTGRKRHRSRSRSHSKRRKRRRSKYSRSRSRSMSRSRSRSRGRSPRSRNYHSRHRYSRSRSREAYHRRPLSRSPRRKSYSPPYGYYRNKPFYSVRGRGRGSSYHQKVTYPPRPPPRHAPRPLYQSDSKPHSKPSPYVKSSPSPKPKEAGAEDKSPATSKPNAIKFELKKKDMKQPVSALEEAKRRIQQHLGTQKESGPASNSGSNDAPGGVVDPASRFGKWAGASSDTSKKNGDKHPSVVPAPVLPSPVLPTPVVPPPSPGSSFDQFENFLKKAKEKSREMMIERNKAFLKPQAD